MSAGADRRFMALALALGARGLGTTWPNPAVGCVIVAAGPGGGRIVGRGHTAPGGRPHAETQALAQAGAAARGATAYVSLEPCAHHGATPPCAGALAEAGIARVVSALEDPDPRVFGQGHAALRTAGVAVETGLMADAARRIHRGFLLHRTAGRPMVTLKLALSLDGRIATAAGESRWITGPLARARVHGLRASHDAVLVGAGTARADDPRLDVRGQGAMAQPVRVVAARTLDLPEGGHLAEVGRGPLWLLHGPGAEATPQAARWRARGARLLAVPEGAGGQLEPGALLGALAAEGITRVLCEGGGALAASLLAADLVDEAVSFTAGLTLGAEGRPGVGALHLLALTEAPRLALVRLEAVGGDVMARWERR